jgi:hypothetical protein
VRRKKPKGSAVTKLEKDDPTDQEELRSWATRTVFFGGLAAGIIIIIGAVGLAFWVFSGTQPTWP